MTLLFALITVLSWGLWLIPAHGARSRDQRAVVFYVTLANLVFSAAMAAFGPGGTVPDLKTWLAIGAGGAVWTLSGACAFGATARLGPARAMGIWSPLNILVSLGWGAFLFGEFTAIAPTSALFTSLAVLALIGGLLAVIRAGSAPGGGASASTRGHLFAIAAGILWGSYFLPIRWSGVEAAAAVLPMAVGMFGAACILVLATRTPVRLAAGTDYLRLPLSGLMWSAGNFGSLALMEQVGTGRGFSIAQLCLVVNALAGIFLLKTPAPGSPAAWRVLAGCSLATIGGIVLGLSR